jgi:hypothetical protein
VTEPSPHHRAQRLAELLEQVADLAPSQRAHTLLSSCPDDQLLREEALALAALLDGAGNFLEAQPRSHTPPNNLTGRAVLRFSRPVTGVSPASLQLAGRTATGASTAITAKKATACVELVCTAASGTTPTLDVVLQTSKDGTGSGLGAWRTVGTFTQLTAAGSQRISAAGPGRFNARLRMRMPWSGRAIEGVPVCRNRAWGGTVVDRRGGASLRGAPAVPARRE